MKSVIQDALTKYIHGPKQRAFDVEMCTVAAKLQVLPLVMDMGGCYALRLDGTVVSFAWDTMDDIEIETNARIIRMALYQGSLKHPELSELVPKRPPDAQNCPHCHGTGQIIEIPNVKPFVCHCGGLGWLLPGEE